MCRLRYHFVLREMKEEKAWESFGDDVILCDEPATVNDFVDGHLTGTSL